MLIVCKPGLAEADFERLAKVLEGLPYGLQWKQRRGRLVLLLDRAIPTAPDVARLVADSAVDYVLRDPSESEIARTFSRRDLIHLSLASTGLMVAGAVLAPLGAYLTAPAGERSPSGDLLVARADSIPVNGSRTRLIDGEEHVVIRRDETHYHAVAATCTHSGVCLVAWDPARRQLVCPCHRGVFDLYGNVVSGPPPRPLATREVVVKDGDVYVRRGTR
jgi:cytochrome b6-f complex iron-sulfur subunit